MLLARGYAIAFDHVREALQKPEAAASTAEKSISDYVSGVLGAVERGEISGAHRVATRTLERALYAQAIDRAGGNLSKAARWLGVTRVTMREKLAALGLRSPAEPPE